MCFLFEIVSCREWKEKFDLVDDEAYDTLTYHFKNTFIFRPDLSGPGLTGNEIITMPHPGEPFVRFRPFKILKSTLYVISVIASMALAVNVDKKPMLPLIAKAIDQLFHKPEDIFWTGRVMDVLFDGVPIDCSSFEFAATAACAIFKSGDVKAIRQIDDDNLMFSLFAGVSMRTRIHIEVP